MGDWTKAERLLVGMGIFSSLCLASAACTASVWMSVFNARINGEGQISQGDKQKEREKIYYKYELTG